MVALSHLVVQYESNFCTVALQFIEEEKNYSVPSPANTAGMWSAVPLIRVTVSDFKHVGFVLFIVLLSEYDPEYDFFL